MAFPLIVRKDTPIEKIVKNHYNFQSKDDIKQAVKVVDKNYSSKQKAKIIILSGDTPKYWYDFASMKDIADALIKSKIEN